MTDPTPNPGYAPLVERLQRAIGIVDRLAGDTNYPERARLRGKSEGLSLALSYVQEMQREASQMVCRDR